MLNNFEPRSQEEVSYLAIMPRFCLCLIVAIVVAVCPDIIVRDVSKIKFEWANIKGTTEVQYVNIFLHIFRHGWQSKPA